MKPRSQFVGMSQWLNNSALHAIKPNSTHNKEFASKIEKDVASNTSLVSCEVLDQKISIDELNKTLKLLKNKKASGFDSVTNEMLKHSSPTMLELIRKLFNLIMESETFPTQWSEGLITPIFKAGDHYDPSNYRGITISNCLGKLFTKILNTRLINYLTDNNIISKYQIGFLPKHRTSDHILVLKTIIDSCKSSRKKLFICFVDLSKAFDTIYRKGLIHKLISSGISSKFIRIITSMYSNVSARIKTSQGMTDCFPVEVGTKQGCNLSPTLFNLYLNDLPQIFNDPKCKTATINKENIPCLMYADDLVLMSFTETGMEQCLANLETYCNNWQLNINTKKNQNYDNKQTQKHNIPLQNKQH